MAARQEAEEKLQELNRTLEQRAQERAEQLATSVIKLEESERRFRILVEGVTDYAIFMLDPSGNVVNWNPGAQRIKGYTPRGNRRAAFFPLLYRRGPQNRVPQKALETRELNPENSRPKAGASARTERTSGRAS